MNVYLAGLDIGTTGSKAMIFREDGTVLANAYEEYPCAYPRAGWVEQDADLIVCKAMKSLKEAVERSGINPNEIASVSLSAQRSCAIIIDRNHQILRPMISWQDNRTAVEVKEIEVKISKADYYSKTGYPNSTTWLLAKMLWIKKNEPEVWKKMYKIVQMHDYFLHALGVKDYYVDFNDAGYFGFFDTVKGVWDDDLVKLFNIPTDVLPIPALSGTPIGIVSEQASKLCGLSPGTQISIGAGDQSAGAVGAGVIEKGLVSISMGTAGAVAAFLDKPFRDPSGNTLVTAHPLANRWLLEGYQAAAASVYRWFRDELGLWDKSQAEGAGDDFYPYMDDIISKIEPGSNGLVVLPYLASAGTPRYNSDARGVIIGLTFAHNRYHLARSFLEGITYDMKDMLNSINDSGIPISEARILGGPTKAEVWNQIQADIYNIPVTTLEISDATVLGAAILGGVGSKVFSSVTQGVKSMVRLNKTYTPDKANNELYEKLYTVFCDAYKGLQENDVFSTLAVIQKNS